MQAFTLPEAVDLLHGKLETVCHRYAVAELCRLAERIKVKVAAREDVGYSGTAWMVLRAAGSRKDVSLPSLDAVRADGYAVRVTISGVALAARSDKGLLNAVYDLAERWGFLFLMPGADGEWAPDITAGRPMIKAGDWSCNPRFEHRGVFGGVGTAPYTDEEWLRFYAKLRFNAQACIPDKGLAIAAEVGLRVEQGGHGMAELLPRDLFEKRPELFRLFQPEDFGGKRMSDSNFCGAHPEVRRIVKENFSRKVRALTAQGVYALHAWADDLPGNGWCMCPKCRALPAPDQAMLAMRMQAEAIAEAEAPMRVPVIAYHDTMYPGRILSAPREGFLLFAPRERCYGHALDDPDCPRNRWYFQGLVAWMEKFAGIGDAHTFEYYFDQCLFRGLYPYLPDVILGDMAAYERAGIETHMSLQTSGPIVAPEYNMLLFARAHWDATLTPERFARELAARLAPADLGPWQAYFDTRQCVFQDALRVCHHGNDVYFDYRWLPETTHPFGAEIARAYATNAVALDAAATALERSSGPAQPERTRRLIAREVARARFEAAELRVMHKQQEGVNAFARYLDGGGLEPLRAGLASLRAAVGLLDVSYKAAQAAGLPDKAYYYPLNRDWLKKEFERKILDYEQAFAK